MLASPTPRVELASHYSFDYFVSATAGRAAVVLLGAKWVEAGVRDA